MKKIKLMKSLIGIGTLSILGIGTAFTVVGCSCSPAKEKKLSFSFVDTPGEPNEFTKYGSEAQTYPPLYHR
jgi:hypothetical protein